MNKNIPAGGNQTWFLENHPFTFRWFPAMLPAANICSQWPWRVNPYSKPSSISRQSCYWRSISPNLSRAYLPPHCRLDNIHPWLTIVVVSWNRGYPQFSSILCIFNQHQPFLDTPIHGWFIMENFDDDWGYPYFRKTPDVFWGKLHQYFCAFLGSSGRLRRRRPKLSRNTRHATSSAPLGPQKSRVECQTNK